MTRRGYLDGAQATLGDLRKREYLRVKCGNCHHAGFVLPRDTPHIPNSTKLIDLPMLLKCIRCGRMSIGTTVHVYLR